MLAYIGYFSEESTDKLVRFHTYVANCDDLCVNTILAVIGS